MGNIQELIDAEEIEVISSEGEYYTGYYVDHNPENCIFCKAGKACQYTVEREFYKLGYFTIDAGVYDIIADEDYVILRDGDTEIQIPADKFIKNVVYNVIC